MGAAGSTLFVYSEALSAYRFSATHPFTPARWELTAQLARQWGLLDTVAVAAPRMADADEIALVHSLALIAAVRAASDDPLHAADPRFGIGDGDTPAFAGMHEAALLVVGSTITAVDAVVSGEATRAFSVAGGLHHAHRDRCAGFCIYNDCAIAIERAVRANPGLRVAYVDIDVHHGDGVQEAFFDRADVLTVSVHESGAYLYPGTGYTYEMGVGAGAGFALNVPLVPGSGDEQLARVFDEVVAVALRRFAPDLIVLQGGADTHRDDPLAGLDATVAGYVRLVERACDLASELCAGRIVLTGGGGYEAYSAVPRMWAAALAVLAGLPVPQALPDPWRDAAHAAARHAGSRAPLAPRLTFDEHTPPQPSDVSHQATLATEKVIESLQRAHPLLMQPPQGAGLTGLRAGE